MAFPLLVKALAGKDTLANLPYTAASLGPLAEALSYSPLWPEDAVLVLDESAPSLAVLGFFDEASLARLNNLLFQLEHVLPSMRYLTYEQVTEACQILANKLKVELAPDELAAAKFVGVPRGGLIVLGILAYLLGLKREQLKPPEDTNAPLVIVDDCALSGLRLGEFKQPFQDYNLVVATLLSPLELREAILERESDLRFVSAYDLVDYARNSLGSEYDAWQARWETRWETRRDPLAYWLGQPEQVAFPWNEPDIGFWNPVTEREESGWHFVPPELCLKHRSLKRRINIYLSSPAAGAFEPSPGVVYGRLGEQVLVGELNTQQGFALEDIAADMWEALLQCSVKGAALELSNRYAVSLAVLETDIRAFATQLVERGLLRQSV